MIASAKFQTHKKPTSLNNHQPLTSVYKHQASIQRNAPPAPFNPHPNNTKAQARKRSLFEDLPKSRNLLLLACSQDELNKMAATPAKIDGWVNLKAYVLSTDIETAWDVLRIILGGAGVEVGFVGRQRYFVLTSAL